MPPPDRERVKAVFSAVTDECPEERAALLERLCDGDEALREHVLRLIRADSDEGGILDAPALAAIELHDPAEQAQPTQVGPYAIVAPIGRGGMGVVYESRQASPARTIALKVIYEGASSPASIRRFRREAEALGRLKHPGVASVYDAGTATARFDDAPDAALPFIAMELIRGETLRRHAVQRRLSLPDRIELVARVGDAVQYAHSMGVIHRDLKPSNILVDEAGQPKVLDFGVATITDADAAQSIYMTMPGQIVGTLAYMSPEQLGADETPVDIRTDVYSLGVILYELLAGSRPLDLESTSLAQAARTIEEVEPRRLGAIVPACRGDIEIVVAKALAKQPDERYPTVAQFTADLRRLLSNEPITARRPSALYVARKFAVRHRALVIAAACVVVSLIAGVVASTLFAIKADADRTIAEREALRATTASDFMESMLFSVTPELARTLDTALLERILSDTVARLNAGELSDEPLIEGGLWSTIGKTYERLGKYEHAIHGHRNATRAYEEALGVDSVKTLHAMANLAVTHLQLRQLDEAEVLLQRVRRRIDGAEGDTEGLRPILERSLGNLANNRNRYDEAAQHFERALELSIERYGKRSRQALAAASSLAGTYTNAGRVDKSIALYRSLAADARELLGEDHPSYAQLLNNLAAAHQDAANPLESERVVRKALAIQRRTLPEGHVALGISVYNLGAAIRAQGEPERAVEHLSEALTIFDNTLPAHHEYVIIVRKDLGAALAECKRFDDAIRCLQLGYTALTDRGSSAPTEALAMSAREYAEQIANAYRDWQALDPTTPRAQHEQTWRNRARVTGVPSQR